MSPFTIEVGDLVQARKETPTGVIPLEFVVAAVAGGVLSGSPLGDLDSADGWTFELCRKAAPGLPEALSDLAVWTVASRSAPQRVVGPVEGAWQFVGGPMLNPADVLAWMPWASYVPDPEPIITVPVDHPDVPQNTPS